MVLGLLLSGNAYAGVNEPGSNVYCSVIDGLNLANKKFIKKHSKKLSIKNETSVLYASCDYKYNHVWAVNRGKDLEKLHKKTYKQCMKYAKKRTGKECYLYAVNDEIVWKFDQEKEAAKPTSICIAGCAITEVHPAAIYCILGSAHAGE